MDSVNTRYKVRWTWS